MIRNVKFSNFYSFKEEQEINFLTNRKKSYSYSNSETKDGQQVTKVAGFIGGNASGKTNVMRLFGFLNYFICDNNRGPLLNAGYKTFFSNNDDSKFNVEFEINGDLYFYNLILNNNRIVEEKLLEKKNVKHAQVKEVFVRKGNVAEYLHEDYFKGTPDDFLGPIRDDVSLIAFAHGKYKIEIINKIFDFFSKIYVNINEFGLLNTPVHNVKSIEVYLNDNSLKEQMEDFVRRFDMGLDGFRFKKDISSNNEANYSIAGIHKTEKENSKDLDFIYESQGTRTLLFILAPIFSALKNNGIVILDEIETGLHPEAVKKIVDFFIDENEKGKAQLIFSSHSLDFMKKFDMQQIFLTSKNSRQ